MNRKGRRNAVENLIKRGALSAVWASVCVPSFALSGMGDRMIASFGNNMILMIFIIIFQVALWKIIKSYKNEKVKEVKRRLLRIALLSNKNEIISLASAWGLTTFTITPYISFLTAIIWVFVLIPFILLCIVYFRIVVKEKTRMRYIISHRAKFVWLVLSVGQCFGGLAALPFLIRIDLAVVPS